MTVSHLDICQGTVVWSCENYVIVHFNQPLVCKQIWSLLLLHVLFQKWFRTSLYILFCIFFHKILIILDFVTKYNCSLLQPVVILSIKSSMVQINAILLLNFNWKLDAALQRLTLVQQLATTTLECLIYGRGYINAVINFLNTQIPKRVESSYWQ